MRKYIVQSLFFFVVFFLLTIAPSPTKAAQTITLSPIADTSEGRYFLTNWLINGYSSEDLENSSIGYVGYLWGETFKSAMKFNLQSADGTINSATLRIYVKNNYGFSGNFHIYTTNNDAWEENTLPDSGQLIMSDVTFEGSQWVDIDVTQAVQNEKEIDNEIGFVLENGSGLLYDLLEIGLKGQTSSYSDPQLVITYQGDEIPPELTALSPSKDAVDVDINTSLELSFSEAVEAGSGKVRIYTSDNELFESISVDDDDQIEGYGSSTLVIDPNIPFDEDESYYILIGKKAFLDEAGNAYQGITSKKEWTFTTEDLTPPSLVSVSPVSGSTNISPSTIMKMYFDETVIAGSGNIYLVDTDSSEIIDTIDVATSSNIYGLGSATIRISFDNLDSATNYAILTDKGVFTDTSGNELPKIQDSSIWSFTTQDIDSPELISYSPSPGSTDVSLDPTFILNFDEPVFLSTSVIYLDTLDGNNVTSTQTILLSDSSILHGLGSKTLRISLGGFLQSSTSYRLRIPSSTIVDASKNSYEGFSNWTFTTLYVDTQPPSLVDYSPDGTEVDVDTDLELFFSESVQAGSGDISLYTSTGLLIETFNTASSSNIEGLGTSHLTLTLSQDLSSMTSYYILISSDAFIDLSDQGNAYVGISSSDRWTFTTKDILPPILLEESPSHLATDVPLETTLSMTFNETVQIGSGNIDIYESEDDELVKHINVGNTSRVSGDGTTSIQITLGTDLESLTDYYILVDEGAFVDTSQNSFLGITSKNEWQFETQYVDTTAPSLENLSPASGSKDVSIDPSLVLTFDEDILLGQGSLSIYKKLTDVLFEEINIQDSSHVSLNDNQVTITLDDTLDSQTSYYIQVSDEAIVDTSGNTFSGISTETTWLFRTADVVPPSLTSLSPGDNDDDVSLNDNLQLTFDEIVYSGTGSLEIHTTSPSALFTSFDLKTSDSISGFGTNTLDITLSQPFDILTNYYITIDSGGLVDNSGNSFSGISDPDEWNFVTESIDMTSPSIRNFIPVDGERKAETSENMEIIFSEPILSSSGNIYLYKTSDDSLVTTIDVESSLVTTTTQSSIAVISLGMTLDEDTSYYVLIDSGAFTDIVGNSFAGVSSKDTWGFKTNESIKPEVLSISPEHGTQDVDSDFSAVLSFNEPVYTASGYIYIHDIDGTVLDTIDISDTSQVIGSGTTEITLTPTYSFESDTSYSITLSSGSLIDSQDNIFEGISDTDTWSFTIETIKTTSQDSSLDELDLSSASLSPDFDPEETSYTSTVDYTTSSIKVIPSSNSDSASISVNEKTLPSGHESSDISLDVGNNTLEITVTAQDLSTTTYKIVVLRSASSDTEESTDTTSESKSSSGTSASFNVRKSSESSTSVWASVKALVGNQVYTIGTQRENDSGHIYLELDNETIMNDLTNNPIVESLFKIFVDDQDASDLVTTSIKAGVLKTMKSLSMQLEITTANALYQLPLNYLNLDAIAETWNLSDEAIDDINLSLAISKVDEDTMSQIMNTASDQGLSVLDIPTDFSLHATYVKDDASSEVLDISSFEGYVPRTIILPESLDASTISTAAVYDKESGDFYSVPTYVFKDTSDNRWKVRIKSMSHSIYALLSSPISVTSVKDHWSESAVNSLASRLILTDVKNFDPDERITRGTFILQLMKGLGLYHSNSLSVNAFTDVQGNSDVNHAIEIAKEKGLVEGYEDGSFRPDTYLTRQEAMVIYSRAFEKLSLNSFLSSDINLEDYSDQASIAPWARNSVQAIMNISVFKGTASQTIEPEALLTNAEAAQSLKNFLVSTQLIN